MGQATPFKSTPLIAAAKMQSISETLSATGSFRRLAELADQVELERTQTIIGKVHSCIPKDMDDRHQKWNDTLASLQPKSDATKLERAFTIYNDMVAQGCTRQQIVSAIMQQLSMTKAGASSYYGQARLACAITTNAMNAG